MENGAFVVQLGPCQSNSSQILQDCNLRVDFVENDFSPVEVEANGVVKLGSQIRQRVQLPVSFGDIAMGAIATI